MREGDIVKFRAVVDPGDDKIRMRLLENPDGGRVLVESLMDMAINPTSIYPVGGANYFSGGVNPRGYYLSAQPEKRGNGSRSFVAFSGTSMVIKQVKRFNQREFDALVPEQADIDKLTAHVMAKRPKQSEAA
jgi:hypothetical protein